MYAGHFAVGVVLAAALPRVHPAVALVGVGFIDILDGVFVGVGMNRITPAPELPLGINLDFVDWDHSLAMVAVWSIVFAAFAGWKWGGLAAAVGAAAVWSHWIGDVPFHDRDLALWPGSVTEVGGGLWRSYPMGSWFIEAGLVAACAAAAWVLFRRAGVSARRVVSVVVTLAVLQVSFWPGLSPVHLAGQHLDGRALALAYAVTVIVGFVVPACLVTWFLQREA